jgi:SAM-dependent methyltransferase
MTLPDWARRRTSFGNQADAYATGRPSYPIDAVDWIVAADARVALDLAAGTGRLTAQLLDRGLEVVAVEPSDEMRAHVPAGARALSGTAEQIPLDDASVDCVVVGQAFHWFDGPAAMHEVARVLRPGGTIGLLWNLYDDSDPVTAAVCDVIGDEARASVIDPDQPAPYVDIDGMAAPERRLFNYGERYDADRLAALISSLSRTILLPADERDAHVQRALAAAPGSEFEMRFVCEVWRGERRD